MERRGFLRSGAAGAGALLAGGTAMAKNAPEYMPIVRDRMESGTHDPCYIEREITEPVALCDGNGLLNPDAVGFSRRPLVRANLSGHWPRKKKWNFWNFISERFCFSITCSDIDYMGLIAAFLLDFETGERWDAFELTPFGRGVDLPEVVDESISYDGRALRFSLVQEGDGLQVTYHAPKMSGDEVKGQWKVYLPPGHETLNIVVPWSRERFQYNSKHNARPVEGRLEAGGRVYEMKPDACHGVQDFGRGMWPYRTYWNWGVATGVKNGETVGVNAGARWTTGTGSNENGICLNGRLHKVMEDLDWSYDMDDPMGPWTVKSKCTDAIDMTLTPVTAKPAGINLGLLATGGVCAFGRWNGVVRADGREIIVDGLMGWAEEFTHRW